MQQSEIRRPRVVEQFYQSSCYDGCRIVEEFFLPGLEKASKKMFKSAHMMQHAIKDCIPYVEAVLGKYGLTHFNKTLMKLESETSLYDAHKVFFLTKQFCKFLSDHSSRW
jgi:hypothetical protein